LSKTLTGLSIQAVSQDLVGARLAGIGTRRVYAITMGVATIIAGIAGMLLAPIFFVNPHMGESPMTKAFIVVILGGLGSLKGTVVAALLVALVEVLVGMYIGVTWASTALFGLMIVILLFKPDGLYGKRLRAA
jgi:branched-chain amino acid transport system permease protein